MARRTIVTVVGARPQFIKAAAVSRAVAARNRIAGEDLVREIIVHTGQHYDRDMSQVFFDELGIPEPDVNLGVGSASHGAQTARMLEALERLLLDSPPDLVLVYGDTNSTLAGALAAAKLHIPVAHVEAGLRSFNKKMPEELNRVLTDHVSALLFCPTVQAVDNLRQENVTQSVHLVGDVMYDSMLHYLGVVGDRTDILDTHGLVPGRYLLATVHRAENTDDPARLGSIFEAFAILAQETPLAVALHPRTRGCLERHSIVTPKDVRLLGPVSYLEMVQLERNAVAILTDSGGVQKEAFFLGKPCLTLREETEWVETVESGWNKLVGASTASIIAGAKHAIQRPPRGEPPQLYGGGDAAERIVENCIRVCFYNAISDEQQPFFRGSAPDPAGEMISPSGPGF